MFNRILGVFKLDVKTFNEIESDPGATSQAAIIVAIVAVLTGIGNGLFVSFGKGNFFTSFISSVLTAFIGWFLWSAVSWFVGTKLFSGQADLYKMLRVIGFAFSPQILSIIPCIGPIVGVIWSLIAGFIAIREGLELDNAKAFFTILIGFVVYLVLIGILGVIFGTTAGLTSILGR